MKKEIWKPVNGYEGTYEVSNLGRCRSLKRGVVKKYLNHIRPDGYVVVTLCNNGNGKRFLVHQIVARAFIPNPLGRKFINHINSIKHDNRIKNLEWCTASENSIHSYRSGGRISAMIRRFAEKNPVSVTTYQYDLNGKFIRKWACRQEAGKCLGIHRSNISHCIAGRIKTAGGFIWKDS
jgi:hypothetical protein